MFAGNNKKSPNIKWFDSNLNFQNYLYISSRLDIVVVYIWARIVRFSHQLFPHWANGESEQTAPAQHGVHGKFQLTTSRCCKSEWWYSNSWYLLSQTIAYNNGIVLPSQLKKGTRDSKKKHTVEMKAHLIKKRQITNAYDFWKNTKKREMETSNKMSGVIIFDSQFRARFYFHVWCLALEWANEWMNGSANERDALYWK